MRGMRNISTSDDRDDPEASCLSAQTMPSSALTTNGSCRYARGVDILNMPHLLSQYILTV